MKDIIMIDGQETELVDWDVVVTLTNQSGQETFRLGKPEEDFNQVVNKLTHDKPLGTTTSTTLTLKLIDPKIFNRWLLEFNEPYLVYPYKDLTIKQGEKVYRFPHTVIQTLANESGLNNDKVESVFQVEIICHHWIIEKPPVNSNHAPIITITGKTCSGKSTLERDLEQLGFNRLISHTTRDIRLGEENGVDYHFIDKEVFDAKTANDEWIEQVEFGGNQYGLDRLQLNADKPNVVVVEPHGVTCVKRWAAEHSVRCYSIFLDVAPLAQADRFLTRIESGSDGRFSLVRRLATMLDVETSWANNRGYDLTFNYDSETKPFVLDAILKLLTT